MVCRGVVVTDVDRPYDPDEEDPLYPKLGDRAGAGVDDGDHGGGGVVTLLRFCSRVANGAPTLPIFSVVVRYPADLLFADAGGESVVYS